MSSSRGAARAAAFFGALAVLANPAGVLAAQVLKGVPLIRSLYVSVPVAVVLALVAVSAALFFLGAAGVLVRVDISPGSADAQTTVAARALTAAALNPGYRKLDLGVTSIAGFDGARWDYLVREHGVELHRTEVVFTDSRGNGYALVEQAPSAVFAQWRRTFDDVRESLVPGAP